LLKNSANANHKDQSGSNPLLYAI